MDAYPLTAPAVRPEMMRFWKISTSTISGMVTMTVAAVARSRAGRPKQDVAVA